MNVKPKNDVCRNGLPGETSRHSRKPSPTDHDPARRRTRGVADTDGVRPDDSAVGTPWAYQYEGVTQPAEGAETPRRSLWAIVTSEDRRVCTHHRPPPPRTTSGRGSRQTEYP